MATEKNNKLEISVDVNGEAKLEQLGNSAEQSMRKVGMAVDVTNQKLNEHIQKLNASADATKASDDTFVSKWIERNKLLVELGSLGRKLGGILGQVLGSALGIFLDEARKELPKTWQEVARLQLKVVNERIAYFEGEIKRQVEGGIVAQLTIDNALKALPKLRAQRRLLMQSLAPQPPSDKADAVSANIAYGRKMLDEIEQENMRGLAQYATGMATAFEDLDLFNRIFAPKEGDEFNLTRDYQAWAEQAGQEFAETFQGYVETASDTDLPGKVAFSENLEKDLADLPVYVRQASEEAGDAAFTIPVWLYVRPGPGGASGGGDFDAGFVESPAMLNPAGR